MGFHTWVNDGNTSAIQSDAGFRDDSQRQTGFQSGTPASSIRVNSALRQANLVACALMDAVGITTDYAGDSLVTARDTLSSHLNTALNTKLAYVKLSGSSEITGSLLPKTTNQIDIGGSNKRWKKVYCDDVDYGGTSLRDAIIDLQRVTTDTFTYSETITQSGNPIGMMSVEFRRVNYQYTMRITLEAYQQISVPAGQTRGLIDLYTSLKPDFDTAVVMFNTKAKINQFYFSIKYRRTGNAGEFYLDNTDDSYPANISQGTYTGNLVYLKV